VLRELYATLARRGNDHVWIHVLPLEDAVRQLERWRPGGAPGRVAALRRAVRDQDNIDVAGHPTTAGCPAFAYKPEATATVVRRLQEAGGILVGKTNLDQFANRTSPGTRSPYGALSSIFDPDYIAGGSSSGSAVAVAAAPGGLRAGHRHRGLRTRARRLQWHRGAQAHARLLSTAGVMPACRSLDCVSS